MGFDLMEWCDRIELCIFLLTLVVLHVQVI